MDCIVTIKTNQPIIQKLENKQKSSQTKVSMKNSSLKTQLLLMSSILGKISEMLKHNVQKIMPGLSLLSSVNLMGQLKLF